MAVSDKHLGLLSDQQFWWSVVPIVFCRGADGVEYFKSVLLKAEHPYKQSGMLETHQREHQKLIDACNPQDIVSAGYIASPHGSEIDDETIDRIFTLHQAWEYHSPREAALAAYEVQEVSV